MMQVLLQRFLRDVIVNPSMGLRALLLLAAGWEGHAFVDDVQAFGDE